jgi:hypothetical protein
MKPVDLEACSDCGNADIRRASSYPVHLVRTLFGSSKRYCPVCGRKWHKGSLSAEDRLPRRDALFFVMLAVERRGLAAGRRESLPREQGPVEPHRRLRRAA